MILIFDLRKERIEWQRKKWMALHLPKLQNN